jgi:hypothetical protein
MFVPLSCHRCAGPLAAKFARLTVTVRPGASLLMTMTVRAPSVVRRAAKTDSVSSLVLLVADTLTSPNVDFAPS